MRNAKTTARKAVKCAKSTVTIMQKVYSTARTAALTAAIMTIAQNQGYYFKAEASMPPPYPVASQELYNCDLNGTCYTEGGQTFEHAFPHPVGVVKYVQDTSPATPIADNFDAVMKFIFTEEGGYNSRDGGKPCPVKYGINKCANPDINVKKLTKWKAKNIYKKRYWDAINADSLSPAMQLLAMDAAVNQGTTFTNKALNIANGDLYTFYKLRENRYYEVSKGSERKYLKPWLNRLERAKLRAVTL